MAKSDEQVIEEFDGAVNMTRKELEGWLQTDESKSVGQGEGESKGHESGRRIVEILHPLRGGRRGRAHAEAGPRGGRRGYGTDKFKLMNWGHDPLK